MPSSSEARSSEPSPVAVATWPQVEEETRYYQDQILFCLEHHIARRAQPAVAPTTPVGDVSLAVDTNSTHDQGRSVESLLGDRIGELECALNESTREVEGLREENARLRKELDALRAASSRSGSISPKPSVSESSQHSLGAQSDSVAADDASGDLESPVSPGVTDAVPLEAGAAETSPSEPPSLPLSASSLSEAELEDRPLPEEEAGDEDQLPQSPSSPSEPHPSNPPLMYSALENAPLSPSSASDSPPLNPQPAPLHSPSSPSDLPQLESDDEEARLRQERELNAMSRVDRLLHSLRTFRSAQASPVLSSSARQHSEAVARTTPAKRTIHPPSSVRPIRTLMSTERVRPLTSSPDARSAKNRSYYDGSVENGLFDVFSPFAAEPMHDSFVSPAALPHREAGARPPSPRLFQSPQGELPRRPPPPAARTAATSLAAPPSLRAVPQPRASQDSPFAGALNISRIEPIATSLEPPVFGSPTPVMPSSFLAVPKGNEEEEEEYDDGRNPELDASGVPMPRKAPGYYYSTFREQRPNSIEYEVDRLLSSQGITAPPRHTL